MKALLFAVAALGQAGCYTGLLLLGNLREHIPEALCTFCRGLCAVYTDAAASAPHHMP